jgi:hypothetical protein
LLVGAGSEVVDVDEATLFGNPDGTMVVWIDPDGSARSDPVIAQIFAHALTVLAVLRSSVPSGR